jgi:hypothetical protein
MAPSLAAQQIAEPHAPAAGSKAATWPGARRVASPRFGSVAAVAQRLHDYA